MKEKFLRKEQVPEFVEAISGRKEIPVKFDYLGRGAKYWDILERDKNYGLGKMEEKIIRDNIKMIFRLLGNKRLNLIDLGCGNGLKTIPFIKEMSKNHKLVNYIALDISTEMLALGVKNIKRSINRHLNIQTFVIDFEMGNFAQITNMLKKVYYPNNLLLILGNTIGNPFDKDRVLSNIRESMSFSDYLIIGIELTSKKITDTKRILEHYKNQNVYNIFFSSLENLGFKPSDGYFEPRYNKRKSQFEISFVFTKNKKLKFDSEMLDFKKGDKVLLGISYKATKESIKRLLEKTGFKLKSFFTDKNNSYAIILCQPTKL